MIPDHRARTSQHLPKTSQPDYEDAQIVMRLYELRRETVMRDSRKALTEGFLPKSYEDVQAITKGTHPLNASWRQVGTYWQMAYGMARHGIVNADYLAENAGEGLLLYAKVQPYLEELRRDTFPTAFRDAEWLVEHSEVARGTFERMRDRVEKLRQG